MRKFRKGDFVGRKSYNKDVVFEITNIIRITNKNNKKDKKNNKDNKDNKDSNNRIYILKGITERIEADSYENDLELIDKRLISQNVKYVETKILNKIKECKRNLKGLQTGKILHLDGDKRYSQKSARYYRSLGLNAIVKNIPENKQAIILPDLLDRYNPDILIITGHDGMIKKNSNFNDIYNYRNSRYFVETVSVARKWKSSNQDGLAIFAGACQSFYEAIISAGANFASSPKRIMIDFIDPLIVAEKIATTDYRKFLSIKDIEKELRNGRDGIDGVGTMGKKSLKM